jgi:hypothetical protein
LMNSWLIDTFIGIGRVTNIVKGLRYGMTA